MSALRIHWCLPRGDGNTKAAENDLPGELNLEGMVSFAQEAEELGIDSLLMGMGCHLPDPLALLRALARETRRVRTGLSAGAAASDSVCSSGHHGVLDRGRSSLDQHRGRHLAGRAGLLR